MGIAFSNLRLGFNITSPFFVMLGFFLLLSTIPLAAFAVFTTTLAIFVLLARAAMVYTRLSFALIRAWIWYPPKPRRAVSWHPATANSPISPASRIAHINGATIASSRPRFTAPALAPPPEESLISPLSVIINTNDGVRDFEGVGGWREEGNEEEEALWMNMNSRLDIGTDLPFTGHRPRGSNEGATPLELSASNQRRTRTPRPVPMAERRDQQHALPRSSSRPSDVASQSARRHGRHRSSGSSSSSTVNGLSGTSNPS